MDWPNDFDLFRRVFNVLVPPTLTLQGFVDRSELKCVCGLSQWWSVLQGKSMKWKVQTGCELIGQVAALGQNPSWPFVLTNGQRGCNVAQVLAGIVGKYGCRKTVVFSKFSRKSVLFLAYMGYGRWQIINSEWTVAFFMGWWFQQESGSDGW